MVFVKALGGSNCELARPRLLTGTVPRRLGAPDDCRRSKHPCSACKRFCRYARAFDAGKETQR